MMSSDVTRFYLIIYKKNIIYCLSCVLTTVIYNKDWIVLDWIGQCYWPWLHHCNLSFSVKL